MPVKKDVVLSSAARQSGKDGSGVVYGEKSVDKLNVRQFCERFCIPNGMSIQLVDGEAVSIEKSADNTIYFTKEQFNAGLRSFSSTPSRREDRPLQPGRLYAFPPTGDPSSGFNKRGSQGACISQGYLGWAIGASGETVLPKPFVGAPGYGQEGSRSRVGGKSVLRPLEQPQPYIANILSRWLPKQVVPGEHFVLKDLPFYERARKADAKARQERLDQREEKRQEGTLRKAPGEKGHYFSPATRPPAKKEKKKKKTKKTLSRSDHTILESEEAEEPEATSSSLQLVVFHSGPSSPQPEPEFAGLQVADKPEEMRSPSELRERLMQRHGKRLHVPIDLGPPQAKKVRLDRGGEDPAPKVPAPATTRPDGDRASASAPAPPDAAGPSTGVAEVPTSEKAPVERGSYTAAAPPSWEKLMSAVPLILHLQEWTMSEAAEVVTFGIRYMMRSLRAAF
ncbi:hypothetical protein CK203_084960 [Vitis vinifera]|uniref:Uncharacterized protein n=1 Tax=Vitis vinifera TaxID=29760 RepID=A0A438CXF1_VITVI|nr:hypothetical protein CK203_084960 [Vitis vinifera]